MLAIFTVVIFLSAALLFLVQPMVAKLLLPLLGGSPAVWNTCMVFFQTLLLAGYFYSHLLSEIRAPRTQAIVHMTVLAAAAIALPLGVSKTWTPPSGGGSPVFWLLGVLAITAGLPYFAVSTTGPLLQRWFSRTDHPHAADPYFLYGASNAGSILGLLSYPFLIEPTIALSKQGWFWTTGYAAFALGVAACAWLTLSRLRPEGAPPVLQPGKRATQAKTEAKPVAALPEPRITNRQRLMWIALAAVPSSLLLGVTGYVSTDVAAVPLLWVIPLTLYLLTFILAFSPRVKVSPANLSRLLAIAAVALSVTFVIRARSPLWALIGLHFGTFFLSAWMCHARLASSRPGPSKLTEFYLWIAVGGVVGGSFNALVAPVVFSSFYEYPIALVVAMLLRVEFRPEESAELSWSERVLTPLLVPWFVRNRLASFRRWRARKPEAGTSHSWSGTLGRWLLGPIVGPLLVALLMYGLPDVLYVLPEPALAAAKAGTKLGFADDKWLKMLLIIPPVFVCFLTSRRAAPFAISLGIILSSYYLRHESDYGEVVHRERTFFGVYEVFERPDGHILRHGTTLHGLQCTIDDERFKPLTYYFPTGPIGQLFDVMWDEPKLNQCGFVGLGAGTLAAYGKAGREITFFEIDPAVVRIAQDPKYFTYLADSDSKPVRIVLGDARLKMAQEPDGKYGLIVLDAFSSDAIPVHLLTREAIQMYFRKLRPDGILAVHVSNRYFKLPPVLGAIARELHLVGYGKLDHATLQEKVEGKSDSEWVMLARAWPDLGGLNRNNDWEGIKWRDSDPLWTDDFSNVMSVIEGWD